MNQLPLNIDTAVLQKGKLMLRALNHPLRRSILQMIHQRGSMTVTEVYTEFKLDQPVASQHLAILRKAGIVLTERRHRFIYYSLNYPRISHIQQKSLELLLPATAGVNSNQAAVQ